MKILSNAPPASKPRELWKHFSGTYFSMRVGLAILGIAMPIVLCIYGKFCHGLDLQPSLSAYFWAATKDQCATFPVRTFFVGFLFAIGILLFAYKGLTHLENALLNFASICASLVAIFPERLSLTEAASDQRVAQLFENCPAVKAWATLPSLPVHGVAAFILFGLLSFAIWLCGKKSLDYFHDECRAETYRLIYNIIAIVMGLLVILGLVFFFFKTLISFQYKVLLVEILCICTFGVYWLVKTYELHLSSREKRAEAWRSVMP